jgi:hypothetical protein
MSTGQQADDDLAVVQSLISELGGEPPRRDRRANRHPLGSERNPVRANMPAGQRAYLDRLRCEDGSPPRHQRLGSAGVGVHRNVVDIYLVQCEGLEPVEIWMDMYHRHVEHSAVPGFTIVPPTDV